MSKLDELVGELRSLAAWLRLEGSHGIGADQIDTMIERVGELESHRTCHVCGDPCATCCSDCAIDLGAKVYVHGNKAGCMDEHEKICPSKLKERVGELERELANAEARFRNQGVEVQDLQYHLDTLRGKVPKLPWRWVKKFQMGGGNHWCLESVPQPDNGVGDGADRTVGIVLTDYWSQHPTELMMFLQRELNLSEEREAKLQSYRELADCVLEATIWTSGTRVYLGNARWADIERLARELRDMDKGAR